MKISINNFANIKQLKFSLEDKKLNFIYGISGSGKSSISKALTSKTDEIDKYKTFGSRDDVHVHIYSEEEIKFGIFDDEAIHEYVFIKSGKEIYDVLFGENTDLRALREELNVFLNSNDVLDIRNIINSQRELISKLELELGLSTTKSGSISKRGVYSTLSKPKTYTNIDSELNINQKSWIKQGNEFMDDNTCPFCSQTMSDVIIDRIKQIINELPNDYQTIIKASENLKKIGISINIEKINEEKEQIELKNRIDKEYKILKELNIIVEALNVSIHNDKSLEKTFKMKPSEEVKKFFSKHNINITSFLEQLEKGTVGYIGQKKKYNSILQTHIKKNIKDINQHIESFGIKYKFVKKDYLSKEEGYNLIHNDADSDKSDFLSTGEKNIIALILFLISNKDKNLIIDDPVSSYDEYRREQILRFIIDYRHQQQLTNYTTLILSHDQIFLKFLTKFLKDDKHPSKVGNVYHLENINGECRVLEICSNDVDILYTHIKRRCIEVNNYSQKVINLRLLYELKNPKGIEYKYLSAILHSIRHNLTVEKLTEILKQHNCSEEKIIENIFTETEVILTKFKEGLFEINKDQFTKFELLCYVREFIHKSSDKKELNSIVHFNYSLLHILNPYKFNFQSEKCYNILNNWLLTD